MPAQSSILSWRPTAASLRDVAVFWAVLGAAAAAMRIGDGQGAEIALITGAVVALATLVTVTFGRKRVVAALADPVHPSLSNWPPPPDEARHLAVAGWVNAGKAAALAALVGVVGGALPPVGVGLVGAGFGGAMGSLLLWRVVRRYERHNHVTVLTASRTRGAVLTLGVAPSPT